MTQLNTKQRLTVLWLAVTLMFGSGIVGAQIGFDIVPATYACGAGQGGGC